MKRLFAALLCAVALSPVAYGVAQNINIQEKGSQEQKDPKAYDAYVGEYQVMEGFTLTITNDNGKLMGQPTGDTKAEFKPEKEADQFFSAEVNAHLKFMRDEQGAVIGVVVTIEGKKFPSKKIK